MIYEITIVPETLAPGAKPTATHQPTIAEATPDGGISSEVLRSIRIGRIVQEILLDRRALQALGDLGNRLGHPIDTEIDRWDATGVTERTKSRRGAPAKTNDFFMRIAEEVLEAQAQGLAVRAYVADKEIAPLDTAKRWIRQARERGFLLSDGHGRRTFRPGPRFTEMRGAIDGEAARGRGRGNPQTG